MTKLALAAAVALATACSSSTFADGTPLEFDWRREDSGQNRQPAVVATGGAGEIVVDGRLGAPTPCQTLTGRGGSSGDRTLELEVRVEPMPGVCIAIPGRFAYTARLHGLEPGTYTLRVRHLYPRTGVPGGTVLETQVAVR